MKIRYLTGDLRFSCEGKSYEMKDIEALKKHRILADGEQSGYLLQIFSKNVVGPFFYEVIQRCGNKGFGEGNFRALFEAIERDQEKRGVL